MSRESKKIDARRGDPSLHLTEKKGKDDTPSIIYFFAKVKLWLIVQLK